MSLEAFSPAQILLIVQTTAIRHSFFLSSLFSIFFTLEFKKLLFLSSFFSLLCSFLLYLAFFSNLLSFDFSFPITLFCLLLPYVLLLLNLFSLYYLSYFKVLYLIPIFHLLCSCFCFLFFFWWRSYDIPVISPPLIYCFLYSLCSFLVFILILFVLFLLYCFLSVLYYIYTTPVPFHSFLSSVFYVLSFFIIIMLSFLSMCLGQSVNFFIILF